MEQLGKLTTESTNPSSANIDEMTAGEIVRLMNQEDATVSGAVAREADRIAAAIELITDRLRRGGRLVYVGAGTSGRLGVLDATECPPTFNSPPSQVLGIIAGGHGALTRSVEGAEDHPELAVSDLRDHQVSPQDAVVGIATSGRTPYVVAALEHARSLGAATIALACNESSPLSAHADVAIVPVVGPEVISGSTRLKAGTATKMVLNMLTTGAMVLIGKTYGNLMVDLRATNTKLQDRSKRIVVRLTGCSETAAERLLSESDGEVKTAIVAAHLKCDARGARNALADCGGQVRKAIQSIENNEPG